MTFKPFYSSRIKMATVSIPVRGAPVQASISASPDPPGPQLHSLCAVCARTRFDLSTLHTCWGLLCVDYVGDKAADSEHTDVLDHHPSRAALEAAALDGCHQCTLLLAALRRRPLNDYSCGSHSDMTHEEAIAKCIGRMNGDEAAKPPPGVTVAFVRNEKEGQDAIVVHCDGKYASVSVAKLPEGKCVNANEKQPLFVMQAKRASHDEDGAPEFPDELMTKTGFPWGTYKAGTVRLSTMASMC